MACVAAMCKNYQRDVNTSLRTALRPYSDDCGACGGSGLQEGKACGTCNGGGTDGGSGCDPNVGCAPSEGGAPGASGGALSPLSPEQINTYHANAFSGRG